MRILLGLVILFLTGSPCFAWHTNTHLQMTRDALSLMPEEFKTMFVAHRRFVEAGITDPDELVKDWQNHYYIPSVPEGGGLERIDKIIKIIEVKFKNANAADTSKQLCYLAHYIGDLWSPESVIKQNTASDMDFLKNNSLFILYEGHTNPIENIHDYLQKRSEWRWRLENSKEISPLLYSEAVNDIARIWLTLWQQSGKTIEHQKAGYLEHPKGVLNVNFQRLLQEEYLEESTARDRLTYAPTREARLDALNNLEAINQETARLKETATPTDASMTAKNDFQSQQNLANLLNPKPDFYILELSLKTVGDKAYLVTRVRNNGANEIRSLAITYPGVRGPVAHVKNLGAGETLKLEGVLPANASKDQIQVIFASQDQ